MKLIFFLSLILFTQTSSADLTPFCSGGGGTFTSAIAIMTNSGTGGTLPATQNYYGVTDTSVIRTVILPPVIDLADGFLLTVKDESGNATANDIIVDGNAAETLDGVANIHITVDYGVLRLIKRNGQWFTL